MARGWESKAVADQIEEGNSRRTDPQPARTSEAEKARQLRVASLLLSKSRLLEQLERAKHPAHRQILLNGLQAIENEIDEISAESNPNS